MMDNSLVVGPDGGMANVVVYARAKRVHESAAPWPRTTSADGRCSTRSTACS